MEYQKIINLLDTTSDNIPRFISKKWIEVHNQSGKPYSIKKQIRFKTSTIICYNQTYLITVMHILLSKELLLLTKVHNLLMQNNLQCRSFRYCNAYVQFD